MPRCTGLAGLHKHRLPSIHEDAVIPSTSGHGRRYRGLFMMSTCSVTPLLAVLLGVACSNQPGPGIGRAGTGGDTQGGQAGGALAAGTTGTTPEGGASGAGGSDAAAEPPRTGAEDSGFYWLDAGVDGRGAGATGDAALSCSLSASQFDNSCKVDSDCVGVPSGDPCAANCASICPAAALNARVAAEYVADLRALVPVSNDSIVCSCPCIAARPCCRQGACHNLCGECIGTN